MALVWSLYERTTCDVLKWSAHTKRSHRFSVLTQVLVVVNPQKIHSPYFCGYVHELSLLYDIPVKAIVSCRNSGF